MVFAQDPQIARQGAHSINALKVTVAVIILQVDIEKILPFASDNGQRLNLRKVYSVKAENGQHFRKASLLMWQSEDNTRLIGFSPWIIGGYLTAKVGKQEKTGKVVFVVLYAVFQNFQPI